MPYKVVCVKRAGPTPALPPGPLAQRSQTESWAQWSLRSGMQSFPESLSEFLQQSGRVQLHRDAGVQHITPAASGWKVSEETQPLTLQCLLSRGADLEISFLRGTHSRLLNLFQTKGLTEKSLNVGLKNIGSIKYVLFVHFVQTYIVPLMMICYNIS